MKKLCCLLAALLIWSMLTACGSSQASEQADGNTMILATTYPMYYLTQRLTEGVENVTVELMVSEAVSCLHDYTLTTDQMKKIERADLVVMNGGGLEAFMTSALKGIPEERLVDTSPELEREDPHTWLSTKYYAMQCESLESALKEKFPDNEAQVDANSQTLTQELEDLQAEMEEELSNLSCREMITFHDGFFWFAESLDLEILAAIEEEEGAEASAAELKEICDLIEEHQIPAIFVEKNGSTNAAEIISRETGVQVFTLNTMMDGQTDYFTAMRENVSAVREALS